MAFDSPMIDHPTTPIGEIRPRYMDLVSSDPNEMTVSLYRAPSLTPASQLTANETTLLLLNMNGSNGSTTFTDSSSNNRTITKVGNPIISTSQSMFGGASGYFNGSSYLTCSVPGGLGSGDFTLEFWYYKTADSGMIFNSKSAISDYFGLDIRHDLQIMVRNSFTMLGTTIPLNTWTHIAVMRKSGLLYRLVNGIYDDFMYTGNNYSSATFYIGGTPVANSGYLTGYIDDLRLTNSAIYSVDTVPDTADGTPIPSFHFPTKDGQLIVETSVTGIQTTGQLYVSVPPNDSFWPYDSLIMEMNGVSGSKIFYDKSKYRSSIRAYGSTNIVTSTGISNGSSVYLNGSTDYMRLPNSPFAFGTSDFTFELWINVQTASTSFPYLFASSPYNTGGGFIIYLPGPGTSWGGADKITFESSGTGALGPNLSSTSTIKNTGWKHIAITRNGSTFRLFVNGIQEAAATNSSANYTGVYGYGSWLGVSPSGTGGALDSVTFSKLNIDLFRVTNGACRYTSNFTPPTSFEYLKWKKTTQAFTVINTATGQTLDPNWTLYSNLAP